MKRKSFALRPFIMVALSAILLVMCALPASAANFKQGYSLSGTSADKMVSIASAQVGRNQGQMGYSDPWCARFVSDVAKIAGEKAAIPYNAGCRQLYNAVIAAGGKDVSTPKKGDIVFFVCTKCNTYSHVGIMVDSKGTCISGNYGRKVTRHSVKSYCGEPHSVSSGDVILKYVRPNYKNPSSSSAVTNKPSEYFNCNVSITCKNGIEVNLYNNPGDTSRVSYFSKGQTASSTRGAKMTDGSTWYQITARDSSGAVKSYWLKYESSKMTVKDLSTPAPQTKPVTLKCNTSSVALDLSNKPSQKVTLTIGGTVPEGSQMTTTISNPNIAAVNWGASSVGLVSSPTITAKAAGTTTITFAVTNGSTLAKTTVQVTVTAPSKPEYFDCNVEIQCVNGQIVNLYSNPGDSSRVTYFSKGQTASSTQGAKMSDGSTWYQILAQDSSGKVGTYWLKYESNKMTVSNIKNTYTVKYDANGGSGAPSAQTKTEGETLILSNSKPSRSEYAFAGWSTSRNGKAEYQPGGQYTFDKNITLYAVWTPQNKAVITLEESTFVVEEYEYFTVNFSYSGDADHVAYNIANGDICRQISTSTWPEQNGMTKMSMDFRASSPGTTTISFELLDKNGNLLDSTTASVTVKERTGDPIPLGSYEYFLGNPEMKVGESLAIWVKVKYSDGTQKDVTRECLLSSSDDDILSVQGDTIIAQKAGTAQLLLTFPEGVTTSKTITVTEDAEVQENLWISFDQPEYTCYVDDEYPVHFRLNYSTNATDATYRWSISDLSLIYMAHSSDYTSSASPEISLRYDKLGDTTLTVTITQDGQTASASCVIHVRERYDRKNTIYIDLENWRDFYGVYPHLKVSYLYPPMQYSVSIISVKTGETVWEADASQSLGMNGGKGQFTEDWDISSLPAGTYRAIATSKNSYGTVTTETYDFTL